MEKRSTYRRAVKARLQQKTELVNLCTPSCAFRAALDQPMSEMAVASARLRRSRDCGGRHGIGMLAIGGATPTSIAHHTANWNLYETEAAMPATLPARAKWRVVTLDAYRRNLEQAKKKVHSAEGVRRLLSSESRPSRSSR